LSTTWRCAGDFSPFSSDLGFAVPVGVIAELADPRDRAFDAARHLPGERLTAPHIRP
jgi:hypothetical protein